MAFPLIARALDLEVAGGAVAKWVLVIMCDVACANCGLAWPGIAYLAERAQLGRTSVKEALEKLSKAGLVTVRAFPRGGRGRVTEYVVLSQHAAYPAPCPVCVAKLYKPAGLDKSKTGREPSEA